MPAIDIKAIGTAGVNVDKDPLELDPNEVTQAQNVVPSSQGVMNRPGLVAFTTVSGADDILGGIGVLEPAAGDFGGLELLYIGRGGNAP